MKHIKLRFTELIQGLPKRQTTKKQWEHLSKDPTQGLRLYELQEQTKLDSLLTKEIGDSLPSWLSERLPTLSKREDHYTTATGNDVFVFMCQTNLSTQAKKIAGSATRIIFRQGFNLHSEIGIIAWAHQTVLSLKIDSALYKIITDGTDATIEDYESLYGSRLKIGNTIDLKQLKEWEARPSVPLQVYLGPRIGATKVAKVTREGRIKLIRQHIERTGRSMFVHGPYDINLCDYNETNVSRLKEELTDAERAGCIGVVMHVGKNSAKKGANTKDEIALERMVAFVKDALLGASENCPLLIETPAGLGGELLCRLEDIISFYGRFTSIEQKRLGICVDTCHVWDAGYDPLAYITALHSSLPAALQFVHFNDSTGICGCAKDRHYGPGGGFKAIEKVVETQVIPPIRYAGEIGYIGVKRLAATAAWLIRHNIPAVSESRKVETNKDV